MLDMVLEGAFRLFALLVVVGLIVCVFKLFHILTQAAGEGLSVAATAAEKMMTKKQADKKQRESEEARTQSQIEFERKQRIILNQLEIEARLRTLEEQAKRN